MRRDLVNETSQLLGIKNKEMIEKDIILHEILYEISKDRFFSDNFAFKGGSCLVKSHLGYFRFSEDIDFTWKKQNVFEKKSQKKIRSYLSDIINKTGKVLRTYHRKEVWILNALKIMRITLSLEEATSFVPLRYGLILNFVNVVS